MNTPTDVQLPCSLADRTIDTARSPPARKHWPGDNHLGIDNRDGIAVVTFQADGNGRTIPLSSAWSRCSVEGRQLISAGCRRRRSRQA